MILSRRDIPFRSAVCYHARRELHYPDEVKSMTIRLNETLRPLRQQAGLTQSASPRIWACPTAP